jgi:hypothetical protein
MTRIFSREPYHVCGLPRQGKSPPLATSNPSEKSFFFEGSNRCFQSGISLGQDGGKRYNGAPVEVT